MSVSDFQSGRVMRASSDGALAEGRLAEWPSGGAEVPPQPPGILGGSGGVSGGANGGETMDAFAFAQGLMHEEDAVGTVGRGRTNGTAAGANGRSAARDKDT